MFKPGKTIEVLMKHPIPDGLSGTQTAMIHFVSQHREESCRQISNLQIFVLLLHLCGVTPSPHSSA